MEPKLKKNIEFECSESQKLGETKILLPYNTIDTQSFLASECLCRALKVYKYIAKIYVYILDKEGLPWQNFHHEYHSAFDNLLLKIFFLKC